MTNQKKKNILIYIPKLYHGGGGERSSLALGSVLAETYNVTFFTQHKGDIVDNPEPILCLGQKESMIWKIIDFIPTAYMLAKHCKAHDTDIVIGNMARANTITMLAAKLFGSDTKNILITRNTNSGKSIHRLWMKLWKTAEKNVAVSCGAEYILKQKGLTNTTTIYNAYDLPIIYKKLEEALPQEAEEYFESGAVFFTIGRLHKQKGHVYLIDAFTKVVEQEPSAKLLIAGGGALKEELQKQINAANMEQHIILLGTTRNVFPFIKRSDCFVLSSLWEGLPTVVVEALISQKYIITTDCMSGPREILLGESYSKSLDYPYKTPAGTLITPPNESIELFTKEFVASCLDFLENNHLPPTPNVEKYSYQAVAKQWIALIETL